MTEASRILMAAEQGDPQAASQLLPLVYDELRKLAAKRLALEAPGQSLDATALVHEVYLRLVGDDSRQSWENRRHFFAAAAEAMRRILIENARRKRRLRHGGDKSRLPLDAVYLANVAADEQMMAVDEALGRLAEEEETVAEVVKLRYFAGLTIQETASILGISARTVSRHWSYARAWLRQQLS
jgi:RNA polymerase sigma factor (TIGR02999 family)